MKVVDKITNFVLKSFFQKEKASESLNIINVTENDYSMDGSKITLKKCGKAIKVSYKRRANKKTIKKTIFIDDEKFILNCLQRCTKTVLRGHCKFYQDYVLNKVENRNFNFLSKKRDYHVPKMNVKHKDEGGAL